MSGWKEEAEAASRTIERLGRQIQIYRRALERVANGDDRPVTIAWRALDEIRRIDEELWKPIPSKRIPKLGKVK